MLVLLGPSFDGTPASYERLAHATGLVAYELRARLRPGLWGVVRTLADVAQAEALAHELASLGFEPVLVSATVAHEPERRIVHARAVSLAEASFAARVGDAEMPIEYAAIACIVRGEVQPGRTQRSSSSSSNFRAVSPASEPPSTRHPEQSLFESYQAADVHFLSVPWILRLDARSFATLAGDSGVPALDALADELAERASVRVDRGARTSSVATFAEQTVSMKNPSGEPPSRREARREHADERFDSYSRLIGEAERRVRVARPG